MIRAQPRPPRDAVHKMATELENYDPPRFQGGVRAIRRRAASATASEPTSITNRASLNFAMAPTRSMIS